MQETQPRFTGGFNPVPPAWSPYEADRTYLELKDGQVLCAHYPLNHEIRRLPEDPQLLGIYLYRDPRDAAVSAALYIKYALTHHPVYRLFSRLTDSEAIAIKLSGAILPVSDLPYDTEGKGTPYVVFDGMKHLCELAYPWLLHPGVAKLRYEDFVTEPAQALGASLEAVGVVVPREEIRAVSEEMNFRAASGGRPVGTEDKASHFRKGVIGDHSNYFTGFHRALCKFHAGEDLIRLCYETGYDW